MDVSLANINYLVRLQIKMFFKKKCLACRKLSQNIMLSCFKSHAVRSKFLWLFHNLLHSIFKKILTETDFTETFLNFNSSKPPFVKWMKVNNTKRKRIGWSHPINGKKIHTDSIK